MAMWLGQIWEVSPFRLAAPGGLSASRKLKKQEKSDKDGQNPTNNQGFEAREFSLEYTPSLSAGGDPRGEYEKWKGLLGEAAPLILGGKRFGGELMQLTEVSLNNVTLDNRGRMLLATIGLSFREDGGAAYADTSPDSSPASSALKVGPSAEEKRRMLKQDAMY